jgi:hypothetical protein
MGEKMVGSSDRIMADVVLFVYAFRKPFVARSTRGSNRQHPSKEAGE